MTRMLRLVSDHHVIRDGDRILEVGTGWLHWEALTLRLFWDVEAVLYDVWDNRQLGGLQNYCRQLAPMLEAKFSLSDLQRRRATSLLNEISRVKSLDQLYRLLGFQYVVESSGSLSRFDDQAFQLVVSAGVLEHVNKASLPSLVADMHRVLKPQGWAVHSIDTADHLSHYDPKVSKKFYLALPDLTWRLLFENHVQYINRVQRHEWLRLFDTNGFDLLDEDGSRIDLGALRIDRHYAGIDVTDLERTVLRFAFKCRDDMTTRHPRRAASVNSSIAYGD